MDPARRSSLILVLATLAVASAGVVAAWDASRSAGLCFDEPKHLATGLCVLEHRAFVARDGSPLAAVFALPFSHGERALVRTWSPDTLRAGFAVWPAGVEFLGSVGETTGRQRARTASILAFAILLALVAVGGAASGGARGAFAAVALVAPASPLLAHAAIVSTDVLAATAAVACALAAGAAFVRGGTLRFTAFALAAALAVLAKLTCIAVVAGALGAWLVQPKSSARARLAGVVAMVAALLLADAAYRLLGSSLLEPIATSRSLASSRFAVYFLGRMQEPGLVYYPVLLAAKAPGLLLAAILASIGLLVADRARRAAQMRAWVAFGAPALALVAAMTMAGYPKGFRFLLPAFPLLALAAAPALAAALASPRLRVRGAAWLAVLLQLAATGMQHPHHLASWSALVGGAERGSRIAVDSNCDWGQAVPELVAYADARRVDRVFAHLQTVTRPQDERMRLLPALAAHLHGADHDPSRERCVIAVSATFARTAAASANLLDPIAAFVRDLVALEPATTLGHVIHVWPIDGEVEQLARRHLAALPR